MIVWTVIMPEYMYIYIWGVLKKSDFNFSENIYLFINIYFVTFKVIPLRYNLHWASSFSNSRNISGMRFLYRLVLFQRCDLYFLNRGKTSSSHGSFEFWKRKSRNGRISVKAVGWGLTTVLFLGKKLRTAMSFDLAH